MRISPGWKALTLLMVVAAHGWLGWQLANYRPDGRLAVFRSPPEARADEVVLVLSFEKRAAPAVRPTMPQPSHARRRVRTPMQAMPERKPGPGPAVVSGSGEAAPARPLDLRLPPAPAALPSRPSPFARVPAMRHEATRFDRAWQSDGNLTQVVARRSMIAGVLLGAMGALRKPCTERERREYDAACVPGQYEHVPEAE